MARCAEALPVAYIEELSALPHRYDVIHHVGRPAASCTLRVVLKKGQPALPPSVCPVPAILWRVSLPSFAPRIGRLLAWYGRHLTVLVSKVAGQYIQLIADGNALASVVSLIM